MTSVQSYYESPKNITIREIVMYGQPCFEKEINGDIKYYLNFSKIFSDVFKASSKFADEYVVMIFQDERKIITHPTFLIKKNYLLRENHISIFGLTFDLHRTIIFLGYAATFID
jgi:hypothetical protein